MSRVVLLLALLLACAASAHAQERVFNATDSGAYAGLHLGYARFSIDDWNVQFSDSVGMASVGGGYRFVHGHLAIEAAYAHSATLRDQDGDIAWAIDLSITSARLIGRLPLRARPVQGMSLFAGIAQNQVRESATARFEGQELSRTFRDGRMSLLAGVEFDFASITLRAAYELFDMDSVADLSAATIGFAFKF